jgi:type IV pilus assembly protein PilV
MTAPPRTGHQGFSMIEVMITLVVMTFGLLGVVKMQTAALANTQLARVRSLVALQAGSMAAAMHGNPFWSSGSAPASFSASGATITDASGQLNQTVNCATSACTPAQLAAADVQSWVAGLNARFPSYTAQISCVSSAATSANCIIKLTWAEKYVAVNRSTSLAAGAVQTSTQQFNLYVTP